MKLLITGSNGLLGHKLVETLMAPENPFHSQFELLATSRQSPASSAAYPFRPMDITDPAQVRNVFEDFKPHAVIHTAAMTQVDLCETEQENCRRVNVTGTENILNACARSGARLIHLSTDFIFDGTAPPYREEDPPHPLSFYGKSKLAAEEKVRGSSAPWTIVRTILVYGYSPGLSRSNMVLWVKNSLENKKTIRVVTDQYRMPTLAEDLAWACLQIASRKACGIYHISGKEMMSIFEIAQRTAAFFKLDSSKILPVTTAELSEPAQRPPKTGFILDKAALDLDYRPRNFEAGLAVIQRPLKKAKTKQ